MPRAKFDPQKLYETQDRRHEQIAREIRKGKESLRSIDPQEVRGTVDMLQRIARRTNRDHD